MSSDGVRCMWMRGGTSKGAYFLAEDLPNDEDARNAFLLRIMGSPDPRQIDGMGGADPLTSKVAIVSRSDSEGIDLDYLFLQVFVDQALVVDSQNCGNLLAGVVPFALERGLLDAAHPTTTARVFMANSQKVASIEVHTPSGEITYQGDTHIDGVPGTASPVLITFEDIAGASCGALLPTGNETDAINGVECTLIDNGMPVVVMDANTLGISGYESREDLDNNAILKAKVEAIRLLAGPKMNLGDVTDKSVPKMSLVSSPTQPEGTINSRTFIPHRCHASIGVLGAVSVATACMLEASPAQSLAENGSSINGRRTVNVEHPSGQMEVALTVNSSNAVESAAIVRTARKLMDGWVFA